MDKDEIDEYYHPIYNMTSPGRVPFKSKHGPRTKDPFRVLRDDYLETHPKRCLWVTNRGEKLRPVDMDDEHLLNTIHMIEREKRFTYAWGALLYEAGVRGLDPDIPEVQSRK